MPKTRPRPTLAHLHLGVGAATPVGLAMRQRREGQSPGIVAWGQSQQFSSKPTPKTSASPATSAFVGTDPAKTSQIGTSGPRAGNSHLRFARYTAECYEVRIGGPKPELSGSKPAGLRPSGQAYARNRTSRLGYPRRARDGRHGLAAREFSARRRRPFRQMARLGGWPWRETAATGLLHQASTSSKMLRVSSIRSGVSTSPSVRRGFVVGVVL